MSKLLAAKGVGARLKLVLNTRLSRVRPRDWVSRHGRGVRSDLGTWDGGRGRPARRMRLAAGLLKPAVLPRLGEDDPLPPADRVVPTVTRLDALYRSHGPKLLRFFSRRAGQQEAHDLLHESFVRLANADITREDALECPEAYLNRIASNLLRDRAKTALQRSLAHRLPSDEVALVGTDLVAALEARDKLNRLQNALARLKPKTCAIFLAHRLDGLSYKQIADGFGLSVKGVEWHMTKAIAHLDRALRRP